MEKQKFPKRKRIPVAVLGATGAVGQRFVSLLDNHPWFQVVALTGSDRAVGQKYADACHWILANPMPEWARDLTVVPTTPMKIDAPLVFSALPASAAREAEPLYAQSGIAVCSNASAFRREPDVPLLLPEVNPEHTQIVLKQKQTRDWLGYIITNPNCTITGLTITLKPLLESFGLKRVFIVSMQAVSGAGYPGVSSVDILGNVVPYIYENEEGNMEWEPRKMLGTLQNESLELANFDISAHANRVPVPEGHLVCLSVELQQPGTLSEVAEAMRNFLAPAISRDLPSAPKAVIHLRAEPDRPQPRLDIMAGNGMTTSVGRLRPDPIFDYKMVILSHNTIRGAAGGSLYNAELLVEQGFIP
ncbi:MAG: aspartate-semialdehyde dehydrogenase [Anaerolineae bacterium UTCFX2]|jgi:aspartate-semialdehyde dehydrogenase|nr:aspartate-semialdehyde dehydrogenase [Anaerolineales bacterium]OQY88889.1 MAG: aspartate-semialdehyde dehydrogenase [Anaerolineae bacterium UTCFX2]